MAQLERRIEKLEAVSTGDEEYPVHIVSCKPWCPGNRNDPSSVPHSLPYGDLRGYSGSCHAQRLPGESEEELKERALEIARKQRRPRCGIVLVEDREMVKCAEHGAGQ